MSETVRAQPIQISGPDRRIEMVTAPPRISNRFTRGCREHQRNLRSFGGDAFINLNTCIAYQITSFKFLDYVTQ